PDGKSRTPNLAAYIVTHPANLAPGQTLTHAYELYAGPKDPAVIKQYPALDGLINYGWFLFNPISSLLDVILRFARGVTGSYGLAIMLLTLLIKVVLFPLTRKSQITMHKMKQIQPFINELREKYKHDRERLAREQMQLMRQHGANPLTGCLPMFFQIPVFIGLFNMIRNAITLRHQSFLWMRDLSNPDTIGHIAGFPINIMPVLMTITWFVQQLTMPKPDDPQQRATQKIMMITPVIFGFMLYNYASGLALYWFTSTLLAICEQKYIKWQIERHHSAPIIVGAETAPAAPVEAKPAPAGLDPRPRKRPGSRRRR
ncbi:MAG TPA: YidC/Oxa1 family insertase periplasmic-domain containing protein, partial [Candidatus Brocadiia bacterium]|nr:YidC/Oxa1 family insertase periplasmic-domain containing protein [Candidatus Brocadiia bacterium]